MSRHHAQEGALANAATTEDSNTLALRAREQTVDSANPSHQSLLDVLSLKRAWRLRHQLILFGARDRPAPIDRLAKAVQDAPEEPRSDVYARFIAARNDSIP